ncbi:serine/threonine protein phosphatase [Candidatus Endobugula sertula]|uniref:Serine/threonine protein phosphatase n=1 Tax=Candidatus Endobugula sertula TaxID=62101 RepID=A0A1D2QQH8_9GAMM|nr:serine/threonine protein phosphatase [Candidatus Endobugula sertula]
MREASVSTGYDIIGDVHGCACSLKSLLTNMGYNKQKGVYQHPTRKAVFVGDIVDRGPHIREALSIVYDMVMAGHAQMVMGNHEYNVYCHATIHPTRDAYLRKHTPHNDRLVAETFEQFANYPNDLKKYLDWFSRLPLFLDMGSFKVVHACWDHFYIREYKKRYGNHYVSPKILVESSDSDSFVAKILDRLLRGTDIRLPNDQVIRSSDGFERRFFRTKFWADNPETYSDVVFQPDPLPDNLLDQPLSEEEKLRLTLYPDNEVPVFFGHYWLQGRPVPIRHNICCLDYSAVKYGRLVAYRLGNEKILREDRFNWVLC